MKIFIPRYQCWFGQPTIHKAFLKKEEADKYRKEKYYQLGVSWTDEVELVESELCLTEGCSTESDGYFFCGPCLQKRQGSS